MGIIVVIEVPTMCIEIEATVLPTKGELGPEEMSFILKSHKKVFSSDIDILA